MTTNLYRVVPAYLLAVGDRVNLVPVLLGTDDDGTDEWLFDLHLAELELSVIDAVDHGLWPNQVVLTFANFNTWLLFWSQDVPVVVAPLQVCQSAAPRTTPPCAPLSGAVAPSATAAAPSATNRTQKWNGGQEVIAPTISRAVWKGTITFGLVSVNVRVFSATQENDISFKQVHVHTEGELELEQEMARMLIVTLGTDTFDAGVYEDGYRRALEAVIASKQAGVVPLHVVEEKPSGAIDLMAALRACVAAAKAKGEAASEMAVAA